MTYQPLDLFLIGFLMWWRAVGVTSLARDWPCCVCLFVLVKNVDFFITLFI